MAIVLLIIAVICAVNWLKWKVSTMAMIYYMEKNRYKLPNAEEVGECTEFVARRFFKI